MEKHPNPKVAYPVAFVLIAALAGGAYALNKSTTTSTSTVAVATATPSVMASPSATPSAVANPTASATVTPTATPTPDTRPRKSTAVVSFVVSEGTEFKKTDTYESSAAGTHIDSYDLVDGKGVIGGSLGDISVPNWLKGPNPDEGYVISKEGREQAITILNGIYADRAISDQNQASLSTLVGEMFTYGSPHPKYRYIENTDGTWRGIWSLNVVGQDYGVYPTFNGVLYNKDLGKLFYLHGGLTSSEATAYTKQILDAQSDNDKMSALDASLKKTFIHDFDSKPESSFSFASQLTTWTDLMKSVTTK